MTNAQSTKTVGSLYAQGCLAEAVHFLGAANSKGGVKAVDGPVPWANGLFIHAEQFGAYQQIGLVLK